MSMHRQDRSSIRKLIVFGVLMSSSTLPSGQWALTNMVPRCLAHIINLATQALISTHSKSEHYNPAEPDADLAVGRDVVGLVRAICVKVVIILSLYHIAPLTTSMIYPGTFLRKKKATVCRHSATREYEANPSTPG